MDIHEAGTAIASPTLHTPLAAIGSPFDGGIYAGICRGRGGAADYHLILLDEAPGEMPWKRALGWAKTAGGDLPSRFEAALLYANLQECFVTDWYWTSTQYAGGEAYAWIQYFTNGGQRLDHKDYGFRARAVRRLPI